MFRIFSEKYCFFVSKICRVFVFSLLKSCEYDVLSIPWSTLYNMCDSSEENTRLLEDVADFGHATHVLSASTTSSLPSSSYLPSSPPSLPSALPTALSSLEKSCLLSDPTADVGQPGRHLTTTTGAQSHKVQSCSTTSCSLWSQVLSSTSLICNLGSLSLEEDGLWCDGGQVCPALRDCRTPVAPTPAFGTGSVLQPVLNARSGAAIQSARSVSVLGSGSLCTCRRLQ